MSGWIFGQPCRPGTNTLGDLTSLSFPRVIKVRFPMQPQLKYYITHMKSLPFHSLLRWKIIRLPILTTSLIHFLLKGWENVLFKLRSERVNMRVIWHHVSNRETDLLHIWANHRCGQGEWTNKRRWPSHRRRQDRPTHRVSFSSCLCSNWRLSRRRKMMKLTMTLTAMKKSRR